jgi:hypothetical protein
MKKWEYAIFTIKDECDILPFLNKAGKEGWELVTVARDGFNINCLFCKRPLKRRWFRSCGRKELK